MKLQIAMKIRLIITQHTDIKVAIVGIKIINTWK